MHSLCITFLAASSKHPKLPLPLLGLSICSDTPALAHRAFNIVRNYIFHSLLTHLWVSLSLDCSFPEHRSWLCYQLSSTPSKMLGYPYWMLGECMFWLPVVHKWNKWMYQGSCCRRLPPASMASTWSTRYLPLKSTPAHRKVTSPPHTADCNLMLHPLIASPRTLGFVSPTSREF